MPLRKPTKEELDLEEKEFERRINEWDGFVRMPVEDILKKTDKRVSVEKLFKPNEYAKLCKLEKKRLKNINKNLTVKYFIGMPLPSEASLRAKVGLPPRKIYKVPTGESENDSDEDWKPYKPKPKAPGFIGLSDIMKRKLFITKKCLVDNEHHDPNALKDFDLSQITESWPGIRNEDLDKSSPLVKEESQLDIKKSAEKQKEIPRRSSRNVSLKSYEEPRVLQDDDYIYCEDCNELYCGDCSKHGPFIAVADTLVKLGLVNRACRTCPEGISIGPSKIRSGGRGAWTDTSFPKNSVFGPYEGIGVNKHDLKKVSMRFEGGYAWEIYKNGKLSHYIDGADEKQSNWMRFINCARNEEEQNVIAYQHKGKIYYRTFRHLQKGMEILVWYGKQYAEQLGIPTKVVLEKENTDPEKSKKSHSFSECEKCGKMFSNKEALERHLKHNHPDRSIKKRFQCKLCSYSSDNMGHLKRHIRTHTREKPFECKTCGKRFSEKSNLRVHERIHTGERNYTCDKCGKKFNQLGSLRNHIQVTHYKRLDHICPVCNKSFGGAGELTQHMITHTNVRAFKCNYCHKRFGQISHLQRHERIHTNERPYKCEHCSAAFVSSSHMGKHVITNHTKRYPHRCSVCEKGFLAPGKLRKHIDKHH